MIIWIDGTYGVGKTAVAGKLKEKLGGGTKLLESDYYYNETLKRVIEEAKALHTMPFFGGTLPQNNMRFLREFREVIKKSKDMSKRCIIDMALTQVVCKENLFDYFQRK